VESACLLIDDCSNSTIDVVVERESAIVWIEQHWHWQHEQHWDYEPTANATKASLTLGEICIFGVCRCAFCFVLYGMKTKTVYGMNDSIGVLLLLSRSDLIANSQSPTPRPK